MECAASISNTNTSICQRLYNTTAHNAKERFAMVIIAWKPSHDNWVKLNSNGTVKIEDSLSGFEGLLRDNAGK